MAQDEIRTARNGVVAAIERAIKTLLEEKHLYQSVVVDIEKLITDFLPIRQQPRDRVIDEATRNTVRIPSRGRWVIAPSREAQMTPVGDSYQIPLVFNVPSVRLYCRTCERREPYNVVKAEDYLYEAYDTPGRNKLLYSDQVFMISLVCQGCKGTPEVVVIRRQSDKNRLILSGRTPMEEVEVPGFLPKPEISFYRDAVVAFNSGKTLAGLFYLRTLVEQYARRVLGESGRRTGDVILAEYATTLPLNLRDSIPSLGELYGKLSSALHAARADAALFEEVKAQLERHFDIRRVFKVPEHGGDSGGS